jgi:signal transduction histidine kinase/CheY-like chemotaxis protein
MPDRLSADRGSGKHSDWRPAVQKIINSMSLYVLFVDRNGRIEIANQAVLQALACTRSEILTMTLHDLDPDFDRQTVEKYFSLLEHEETCTVQGLLKANNEKRIQVQYTLTLISLEKIKLLSLIIEDKGREISRNEYVQSLENELAWMQEISESGFRVKSEFIANMNHEIRTPMNAIIGYAEMLAASQLGKREQRFVHTILKSGATLLSILNDVMELSKLEAGRLKISKTPSRLHSLLDEPAELFIDQIQAKALEFTCSVQPDLPGVFILDDIHCRQIIGNLLNNAVKFTQAGFITLSLTGQAVEPDIYELCFTVTDSGQGLRPEEQEAIFDLFEQRDEPFTGQGGKRFGLALCSRLALMMGGRLSVDSTFGIGSSFQFILPARAVNEGQVVDNNRNHSRGQDQEEQPPVLLVVDDMPMIADVIRDYFARDAIEVLSAENSDDGLDLAVSRQPDLILMDLNLAGEDGRDVTSRLKDNEKTAHIPVVVMSGRMLDEEEYSTVFDDFLAKPFHLEELQRVVDRFTGISAAQEKTASEPAEMEGFEQPGKVLPAGWTAELDKLLDEALAGGSLDAATALGARMLEIGREHGFDSLQETGSKLARYASSLDITGVEQLLAFLNKYTPE